MYTFPQRIAISTLFILTGLFGFAQEDGTLEKPDKQPFILGETVEIYTQHLNEKRKLHIYLPQGYHPDSLKTYPVIYLLDGSKDEDFIHIVGLVQFATFPWVKMLPESIVVGIGNVDRRRDFTFPTTNEQDKQDFPTTGGSERFIQFIESELQPFIEKNYLTSATKTIIGQSLGGLLATEILFKKPALFTHYIIVSPSLWWDDQSLLRSKPAFTYPDFQQHPSVFVSVGKEGDVMENDAKALAEILNGNENIQSTFHLFEGQDHGNILHLAVYRAFDALFNSD